MIPVPEEIKGLLRDLLSEQVKLQGAVSELDGDVKGLAASNAELDKANRRSKAERVAIVVTLLVVIVGIALYVDDALQRRAEFRQQLHDLACLAVRRTPAGVSGTVDDLRAKYGCPPYHALPAVKAPAARARTATATATASVTATATVVKRGAAVLVPVPVSPRTVTVTATATATRVVTRPARVVTVTATPSCRLLPGVLC